MGIFHHPALEERRRKRRGSVFRTIGDLVGGDARGGGNETEGDGGQKSRGNRMGCRDCAVGVPLGREEPEGGKHQQGKGPKGLLNNGCGHRSEKVLRERGAM